jgi:hypothetical protein
MAFGRLDHPFAHAVFLGIVCDRNAAAPFHRSRRILCDVQIPPEGEWAAKFHNPELFLFVEVKLGHLSPKYSSERIMFID